MPSIADFADADVTVLDASAPNPSALARLLGLPDNAGEAAIVDAIDVLIEAKALAEIESALGLPAGSGLGACLPEIERLRAEEAALVAKLKAEFAANLSAIRDLRVREMMLDATREARETLAY